MVTNQWSSFNANKEHKKWRRLQGKNWQIGSSSPSLRIWILCSQWVFPSIEIISYFCFILKLMPYRKSSASSNRFSFSPFPQHFGGGWNGRSIMGVFVVYTHFLWLQRNNFPRHKLCFSLFNWRWFTDSVGDITHYQLQPHDGDIPYTHRRSQIIYLPHGFNHVKFWVVWSWTIKICKMASNTITKRIF